MSFTIAAIPRQDDYVWNVSSEKVPHLTILFLGDSASEADISHITDFVQHTSGMLTPFGLDVDYRDKLGVDEADVLFFNKSGKGFENVNDFRGTLLQDKTIRLAYESVQQFPEWTPHLTLGFPATPAKKDQRDYPGFNWMMFDKIVFWTGDFTGSEFRLKSPEMDSMMSMSFVNAGANFLEHFGVRGMHWGVRRSKPQLVRSADAQRHADNAKKHLGSLSDKDLKDLHNRLQTEANVRKLQGVGKSSAQRTLDKLNKTNATLGLVGAPGLAVITKATAGPIIAAGAIAAGVILGRTGLLPIHKMGLGQ